MGKGACYQAHILPQCVLLLVLLMKANQLIIHELFHICEKQNLQGHQLSYMLHRFSSIFPGFYPQDSHS